MATTTTTQKVFIPSSNGNLAAVIHRPDHPTKKLAILCPGYLDTKDYDSFIELADTLTAQGFTVVRFDPTGTWESDGRIDDYTTGQYIIDIKNVLEYMTREGDYDYILVGGHSRGGMVSTLYAAQDPRVSVVLGIMLPSSHLLTGSKREEWEQKRFKISKRDIPKEGGTREFSVPYSHIEELDRHNVLEEVKKVHVPLILIAGAKDTTVPPESVKLIYDNANEPKRFILLEGISHDYRHRKEEVQIVNARIIEELKKL